MSKESFELIETMLWDQGYPRLQLHKSRLVKSAAHFHFSFDPYHWERALLQKAQSFTQGQKYKVRSTLNIHGQFQITQSLLPPSLPSSEFSLPKIALAKPTVQSTSPFLYHKTTHRELYNQMYQRACSLGLADIIFCNEKGHLTEGSITNLFLLKKEIYYTPAIHCGLLGGTYRQHLLSTLPQVKETELYFEDLQTANQVLICNAIRGLIPVQLDNQSLVSIH